MDPYELLKTDHDKVAELFERMEGASDTAKSSLFKQIQNELEIHTQIEEKIFYPALKNGAETRDITLEAYEEHSVVKELLAELAAVKPGDHWDAKLTVLKENVEHHVDEEENDMFDKARDVLSTEEAEALGDRMAAEKQKLGAPAPAPKPGIIKTVVNALFGSRTKKSGQKKAGAKKAASKSARTTAAKQTAKKKAASSKKAASKKTAGKGAKKSGTVKRPAKKKAAKKRSR